MKVPAALGRVVTAGGGSVARLGMLVPLPVVWLVLLKASTERTAVEEATGVGVVQQSQDVVDRLKPVLYTVDCPQVCCEIAVETSNVVVSGRIDQPVWESFALNCMDTVDAMCV